jgi:GntR family transcriptional regulator
LLQNNLNHVPAYQRIKDTIRLRIESGELRPGDSVNSERELAKIHLVSLMTARHALASLERDGLVERKRGVGSFISKPKIHINKLISSTEQLAERGLAGYSKILFSKIVHDEQEVAARLALPPGSGIVKLTRLRYAAGEPYSLQTCYLDVAQFPDLLSAPLVHDSLFQTLERNYTVMLEYADEEIDATVADAKIAKLLAVPKRSSILRIRQLIYSTGGVPLMYVLGFYRSDRHNLVIRRFREKS